jgi:putative membrane protein
VGRRWTFAAAALGLLIAAAVIGYFKVGTVLSAMKPIGLGGFALAVAAQLALFIPLGLAWWLAAAERLDRWPVFVWGRILREAATDVLPFSHVGGVVIAVRAAALGGVAPTEGTGSCVVDITCEVMAQLLYTLFGITLLAMRLGLGVGERPLVTWSLVGLVVATGVVAALIVTQRRGLRAIERLIERRLPAIAGQAAGLGQVVERAWGRPWRLAAAIALHLFAWFAAAGGTWLILDLIGHPLSYLSVAAIESLLFATRNAAFMMPSGLGVQEAAYALLGPLFGLPAEAALALSLLKRARDVAIAVPMLLTWQVAESRRTLRRLGGPESAAGALSAGDGDT